MNDYSKRQMDRLNDIVESKRQKEDQEQESIWMYLVLPTLTLLALALFGILISSCGKVYADDVNLDIISKIESSNNPRAYNKVDGGRGLFQITPICLKEYNNYNKIKYSKSDLWNPQINRQIASWYINTRIPAMLSYYKVKDSIENRIISFNSGIKTLILNKKLSKITKQYLSKYRNGGYLHE